MFVSEFCICFPPTTQKNPNKYCYVHAYSVCRSNSIGKNQWCLVNP